MTEQPKLLTTVILGLPSQLGEIFFCPLKKTSLLNEMLDRTSVRRNCVIFEQNFGKCSVCSLQACSLGDLSSSLELLLNPLYVKQNVIGEYTVKIELAVLT